MSGCADRAMAEGDTNAHLRVTFREANDRTTVEFEQRSGQYDGEHFALVFDKAAWRQFVADVNEFDVGAL